MAAGIRYRTFLSNVMGLGMLLADKAMAASDSHHDGNGSASAGLPQFDPSSYPSQIFWLTITFVVLYVIFSKKVLPDISSTLEDRKNRIDSDIETAEKLKKQAEETQAAYEQALEAAHTESSKLMIKTQDALQKAAVKKNDDFRSRSDNEIQALEKRLEQAKQSALEDMNDIVAEATGLATEKIIGVKADSKAVKTVVESLNSKPAMKKKAA